MVSLLTLEQFQDCGWKEQKSRGLNYEFKTKSQSNVISTGWEFRVSTNPDFLKKITQTGPESLDFVKGDCH